MAADASRSRSTSRENMAPAAGAPASRPSTSALPSSGSTQSAGAAAVDKDKEKSNKEKSEGSKNEKSAADEADQLQIDETGSRLLDLLFNKQDAEEGSLQYKTVSSNKKVKPRVRALFEAANAGHVSRVKDFLSGGLMRKGLDVETRDEYGRTVLISAAAFGRVHVVKLMILLGAKLDARDAAGGTALVNAVVNGRIKVVKALLHAGSRWDVRDNAGGISLVYAAQYGHWEILQYMLDLPDVDINAQDGEGCTALMRAMERPHEPNTVDILYLLAQRGASFDVRNKKGRTAFETAYDPRNALSLLEILEEFHPQHPEAIKVRTLKQRKEEAKRKEEELLRQREEEKQRAIEAAVQRRKEEERRIADEAKRKEEEALAEQKRKEEQAEADRKRLEELEAKQREDLARGRFCSRGGLCAVS
jgi:ankyrin repeat protein